MKHDLPEDVRNSAIIEAIDEYIRLERNRQILKDHWFGGLTFEALAEKNDMSTNAIKNIIYGMGDKVLARVK